MERFWGGGTVVLLACAYSEISLPWSCIVCTDLLLGVRGGVGILAALLKLLELLDQILHLHFGMLCGRVRYPCKP